MILTTPFSSSLFRRPVPWGWTVANSLVLNKVKERIGFNEAKILHVGAAPVHRSVLEHFMKYNIPVLELYGMSENSGPASFNTIDDWRLSSVGKVMLGTKIKIDNPDENGEGEVSVCVCVCVCVNSESYQHAHLSDLHDIFMRVVLGIEFRILSAFSSTRYV